MTSSRSDEERSAATNVGSSGATPNEQGVPVEASSAASPRPPWHGNWYREWSIGRFAFEIEWVPRGHYYTFTFSINSTKKQLERMGA